VQSRDIPSRCGGKPIRSLETIRASIRATSTTRSAASRSGLRSGFAAVFPVDDFALTVAERRLLEALDHHGVRYILLGMGATFDRIMASKRATKRAKDLAQLPALEATLLARKQNMK
jgi:hypothetical protein